MLERQEVETLMRVHSGVQNRFFIDSVGNVGIKTTLNTPNIELDVSWGC